VTPPPLHPLSQTKLSLYLYATQHRVPPALCSHADRLWARVPVTMGAQQSSGRDSSPQTGAAAKRCYYEVLGVERQATDDE